MRRFDGLGKFETHGLFKTLQSTLYVFYLYTDDTGNSQSEMAQHASAMDASTPPASKIQTRPTSLPPLVPQSLVGADPKSESEVCLLLESKY